MFRLPRHGDGRRTRLRRLGQMVAVFTVLAVGAGFLHAKSPGGACAAAKQKAAAKKIKSKLKCYQRAFAQGLPVDPNSSECLAAADAKFNDAILKADARGFCAITGDANALEAAADTCVNSIVALTPGTTTTTTTVP